MGDRGNIVLTGKETFPNGKVYLYTHWGGSEIKQTLAAALGKRQSWGDGSYLARIIFTELTRGVSGETGSGLSGVMGDNEHPLLFVDVDANTVWEEDADCNFDEDNILQLVSFDGFLVQQEKVKAGKPPTR